MSGRLRTSRQGLELIKSFEGFRPASARLPDGRWTVGYGHVRSAREGVVISERDAEDLLRFDLRGIEEAVNELAFTPLTQNQFDALASLVFNISPGQFKDSDVLSRLNAGDYFGAAQAIEAWRKARINGRLIVVDALVRRRAIEKALFLEPDGGRPAAPTPIVTPELDKSLLFERDSIRPDASRPAMRAEPAAQPRTPEEDDIASAIAGLAQRQNAATIAAAVDEAAPSPVDVEIIEETFLEVSEAAEPAEDAAEPEPAPETPEEAARVVAARLARILARAEVQVDKLEAADAAETKPADPEPAAEIAPPPVVKRDIAETRAPETKAAETSAVETNVTRPRPRIFVDDTEIYEPARDPAELFAEIEAQEERAVREWRPLQFNFSLPMLGPWLAVLGLSVIGLAIGLVETVRNADVPGNALAGALTVAAVFGLMLVMSVYFIVVRALDPER